MNQQRLRPIIFRSAAVWLVIIAAEIVHGILRGILLAPRLGEFRANQLGVFTGSAIILVIAYLTLPWIAPQRRRERLWIGAIWLVLTVAFEILCGRFVVGLSWEQLAASYNLLAGGLMPLGLLILFLSPSLVSRKLTGQRHV